MADRKQPPPVRETDPNAAPEAVAKALLKPARRPK